MRICLATNYDNGKGLQYDAELLANELTALGHTVLRAHTERDRTAPESDLIVFLETVRSGMFASAPRRWAVPNPEWWEYDEHLGAFELVLCKTRDAERIFAAKVGERARFVGWAARDRILAGPPPERPPYALHVGGGSILKGTEAVIQAWDPSLPALIVVSSVWKGRAPRNVTVHKRLEDAELRQLQGGALLHVQPSAYEGFGMVLWEALSTGAPLVTTNAPPMNELPAVAFAEPARYEALRAATLAHVTPASVREAVGQALSGPRTDAGRRAYLAQGLAFRQALLGLLATQAPRRAPQVALVYPAHPSAAALVQRTLMSLRAQTSPDFEVVVAADGGDDGRLAAAVAEAARLDLAGRPVAAKLVASPRPRGAVPHRNHARNAGWQASTAPLVAVLDCDFLAPPHFIEHLLVEHAAAVGRGTPAMFTPCLAGVGGLGPSDWLAASDGLAAGRDLALRVPELDRGIWSGFPERATDPAAGPASVALGDLPEGMPILPRAALVALDGFSEDFGEWGGDKEEFIDRVKGCARAGVLELRLLTSVTLLHQPHERDPEAFSAVGRKRQAERERRARLIERNAAWWRGRLDRVREAMAGPEWKAGVQPLPPSSRPGAPAPAPEPAPAHLVALAVAQLLAKSRRDRTACIVVGRWAAPVAEALKAEGVDARTGDLDALIAGPNARQAVLLDALGGISNERLAELGEALRRHLGRGAPVVLVERTRLGSDRNDRDLRPPIDFQRTIRGLTVSGQRAVGGAVFTLFAGRLTG